MSARWRCTALFLGLAISAVLVTGTSMPGPHDGHGVDKKEAYRVDVGQGQVSRQVTRRRSALTSWGSQAVCRDGVFVNCGAGDKPEGETVDNQLLAARGRSGGAVRVSGVNIPGWLKQSWLGSSRCYPQLCTFSLGPVTEQTDLVVVHAKLLPDSALPAQRWPGQLYLLINWEPPGKLESPLATGQSVWNDQFNLTMSYRLDSDSPYTSHRLRFEPKPLGDRPHYETIARRKTKMVAWFVSNCQTLSMREEYVRQLQHHIEVDIYGGCGQPVSCPFNMDHEPCLFEVLQDYRFYLSFENTLCTDYVTEKVFKIYDRDTYVIPVVRGGLDYDLHLPNHTFINAAHFASPRDLAAYLNHLAANVTSYAQHLELKDMYHLDSMPDRFCQLCQDLHALSLRPHRYDMVRWLWQGCQHPQDLDLDLAHQQVMLGTGLLLLLLLNCWLCRHWPGCARVWSNYLLRCQPIRGCRRLWAWSLHR